MHAKEGHFEKGSCRRWGWAIIKWKTVRSIIIINHYIIQLYRRKESIIKNGRSKQKDIRHGNTVIVVKWAALHLVHTSKEPVCPRVELILKIIIILLIIFLGFIKSKPC